MKLLIMQFFSILLLLSFTSKYYHFQYTILEMFYLVNY